MIISQNASSDTSASYGYNKLAMLPSEHALTGYCWILVRIPSLLFSHYRISSCKYVKQVWYLWCESLKFWASQEDQSSCRRGQNRTKYLTNGPVVWRHHSTETTCHFLLPNFFTKKPVTLIDLTGFLPLWPSKAEKLGRWKTICKISQLVTIMLEMIKLQDMTLKPTDKHFFISVLLYLCN